jgi:hypothetical protein
MLKRILILLIVIILFPLYGSFCRKKYYCECKVTINGVDTVQVESEWKNKKQKEHKKDCESKSGTTSTSTETITINSCALK